MSWLKPRPTKMDELIRTLGRTGGSGSGVAGRQFNGEQDHGTDANMADGGG